MLNLYTILIWLMVMHGNCALLTHRNLCTKLENIINRAFVLNRKFFLKKWTFVINWKKLLIGPTKLEKLLIGPLY